MTQANISSQPEEKEDLLVKVFNKLLSLETEIKTEIKDLKQENGEIKKDLKEIKLAQEETNKRVSVWDARLWTLSLILIGVAVTAFITITLTVSGIAIKILNS